LPPYRATDSENTRFENSSGISPPAPSRTVRERLRSHSSHHPAIGRYPSFQCTNSSGLALALSQSICPAFEFTIVVQPSTHSQHRIEALCYLAQVLIASKQKLPPPDCLPHGPLCITTDGRNKVHEQSAVLVDGLSLAKRVSKKRRLPYRIFPLAVAIRTVHNSCRLRMERLIRIPRIAP